MLALALAFVAIATPFLRFTCDNSYITFRYANNAAHGLGLVFNPGERVEGYSNPLWLGLLYLGARAGLEVVGLSKVLGLAAGIGCLLFAVGIVQRLALREKQFAPWVAALLATNAGLVYYAVSGMETVLYACLLTGIAYFLLTPSARSWWGAAGLATAAALTRPEGIAVLLVVFGWRLVRWQNSHPAERQAALLSLPAVLALIGGFFLWRHAYFGDWLPNTYYAKPPGVFGSVALAYLREYLTFNGVLLWLAAVIGAVWWAIRNRPAPADLPARPVDGLGAMLLMALVQVALLLHAGGDWMGLYRFLVPLTPMLLALGYAGLLTVVGRWSLAFALVLAAINVPQLIQVHRNLQDGVYPYNVMAGISQERAGRWLKAHFPPDTVLSCKRIGGISYYSGMRMVDHLGLVDRKIALLRHRFPERGEAEFAAMAQEVFSRKPDLILLCPMWRWPQVPPDKIPAGLPGRLRDADKPLFDGMREHGYRFLVRLPQGSEGEVAIYRRADVPPPPLTGLPQ